ncbi:hypothetical protein [Actinomyces capricornis]|uniref:hypothetical protein n=1 Tax=Actinomyces capricornis TaxID=2755559 RepID=UPI001CC34858|nr:hypothetical protein [Actinomyces capricornis]
MPFITPPSLRSVQEEIDFYLTLLWLRDKWIARKVKYLEYLSKSVIKNTILYDIDFQQLRTVGGQRLGSKNPIRILLPLDLLDDRPYMTEGFESPWGSEACLATRHEKAYFQTLIFIYVANIDNDLLSKLNQDMINKLFNKFMASPTDKSLFDEEFLDGLHVDNNRDSIYNALHWFRSKSFVLVNIPNDPTVRRGTIRLSFITGEEKTEHNMPVDAHSNESPKFIDRILAKLDELGLRSSSILLLNANGDEDLWLHLRVLAPEGMRVDDVKLGSVDNRRTLSLDHSISHGTSSIASSVLLRSNGRVVSASVPPATDENTHLNLRIIMNPKREILAFPALVASIISYFIVQVLAYYILCQGNSSDSLFTSTQGMAPLAALIPAFSGARIIASKEHEAVSFALGLRRALLGIGAVLSVMLSTVLAFGTADKTVDWRLQLFLYICLLSQLLLTFFFLFDILRIEFWRRGLRVNYNYVVLALACFLFEVWSTIAYKNSNLFRLAFEGEDFKWNLIVIISSSVIWLILTIHLILSLVIAKRSLRPLYVKCVKTRFLKLMVNVKQKVCS